jgi:hypothetical protein
MRPHQFTKSASDIVDDAGLDGPGESSHLINSCPDSVDDPAFGSARSGLDTGDGAAGIDGSGRSKSVHARSGPDGGELDDGRAADGSSSFAKWFSKWFKYLSHTSSNSLPRFPKIVIASSDMCTTSTPA